MPGTAAPPSPPRKGEAFNKMVDPLGFTGSPLDRAEALRRDEAAIAVAADDPAARWLLLDALKPVLDVSGPMPALAWQQRPLDIAASVLLGLHDGAPRFAAPGPAVEPLEAIDARSAAMQLPGPDAAIVAHARSLIDWHARNGFCANCGHATLVQRGGIVRHCPHCGAEHYPRTDPVVIMLIIDRAADTALLGRGPRMPEGFLSALAGFVEVGESLEEAVRREVREEAGVRVGAVRYVASQPWPSPSSLMLGCIADATATEIIIDPHEIEEARWVPRATLAAALAGDGPFKLPPPLAIAHHLIRCWLETNPEGTHA